MINGQKFIALSKYNGRLAKKHSDGEKGIYTVDIDHGDHIVCIELSPIPMQTKDRPIQIFRSVFEVIEGSYCN